MAVPAGDSVPMTFVPSNLHRGMTGIQLNRNSLSWAAAAGGGGLTTSEQEEAEVVRRRLVLQPQAQGKGEMSPRKLRWERKRCQRTKRAA